MLYNYGYLLRMYMDVRGTVQTPKNVHGTVQTPKNWKAIIISE